MLRSEDARAVDRYQDEHVVLVNLPMASERIVTDTADAVSGPRSASVAAIRYRMLRTIWLTIVMLSLGSSAALAQSRVRVSGDGVTIWRRDAPAIVATTVKAGTVLEVVGQEPGWYLVLIPRLDGNTGEVGRLVASQAEVVDAGPASLDPAASSQRRGPSSRTARVEVLGFGDLAYGTWLARDTFDAILGSANALLYGGGVQARFRHLFIEGTVERFQKAGTRVFVDQGRVFTLGIADTVRVIPIAATVGYRHPVRRVTLYAGGGVGTYLYKETSDFAAASENPDQALASYHVLAGVESVERRLVRVAFEVQFTTVPGALGGSGTSAAFNEHNLGGVQARVKVLVGR
jgi:hypothetical protein